MPTLKNFLTSVTKLAETRPNNQLKSLCSSKDRNEAEVVRSQALEQVNLDSSDDEQHESENDKAEKDEHFDFAS